MKYTVEQLRRWVQVQQFSLRQEAAGRAIQYRLTSPQKTTFLEHFGLGNSVPALVPYKEAKLYARSLGGVTYKQWAQLSKDKKLPPGMPASPWQAYPEELVSWKDFSGRGEVRPFKKAREWATSLGLTSTLAWERSKKPSDIPGSPWVVYKNDGYVDIYDWLGFDRDLLHGGAPPFEKMRKVAQAAFRRSDKPSNITQWWKGWCVSDDCPDDMPTNPWTSYRGKGWKGLNDWLGVKNPRKTPEMHAKDAKTLASKDGVLKSCAWLANNGHLGMAQAIRASQKTSRSPFHGVKQEFWVGTTRTVVALK